MVLLLLLLQYVNKWIDLAKYKQSLHHQSPVEAILMDLRRYININENEIGYLSRYIGSTYYNIRYKTFSIYDMNQLWCKWPIDVAGTITETIHGSYTSINLHPMKVVFKLSCFNYSIFDLLVQGLFKSFFIRIA